MENTENQNVLEKDEIMRLSVRVTDSKEGKYIVSLDRMGPKEPMVQALMYACQELNLVCLPATVIGGIPAAIMNVHCVGRNPSAPSKEGEGAEEGPGNKEE